MSGNIPTLYLSQRTNATNTTQKQAQHQTNKIGLWPPVHALQVGAITLQQVEPRHSNQGDTRFKPFVTDIGNTHIRADAAVAREDTTDAGAYQGANRHRLKKKKKNAAQRNATQRDAGMMETGKNRTHDNRIALP